MRTQEALVCSLDMLSRGSRRTKVDRDKGSFSNDSPFFLKGMDTVIIGKQSATNESLERAAIISTGGQFWMDELGLISGKRGFVVSRKSFKFTLGDNRAKSVLTVKPKKPITNERISKE